MSNDTLSGKRTRASALTVLLAAGISAPAVQAQQGERPSVTASRSEWGFEITPYVWAAGMNGDVTVRGQTVKIDQSFSDIMNALEIGGGLLGVVQYRRFVFWGQVDYLKVSTDNLDKPPARGSLDTEFALATLGAGYQFNGFRPGQTFDVLLGARVLSLKNDLQLNGIGRFEKSKDIVDPVLIVRPSFPLSTRWRFNPTISVGGGGDSDTTWELQPQFQYQMSDNFALRLGYRRVHYKIEADTGNKFDGDFEGFILGLGGTWGGAATSTAR